MKKVGLIIAQNGYQQTEYGTPKKILEDAGFAVVTIAPAVGQATAKDGSTTQASVAIADIDPHDYDGIFVIGGPGALTDLDTELLYSKLTEFQSTGMPYGAICISSRILAKAGVLHGKKATGWNDDAELEGVFAVNGAIYEKENCVVDGMVITADGPKSAEAFGKAIVATLA